MAASKCINHDLATEDTSVLSDRFELLCVWPRTYAESSNDPHCGCGEDGEGGRCEWDSTYAIDAELSKRAAE